MFWFKYFILAFVTPIHDLMYTYVSASNATTTTTTTTTPTTYNVLPIVVLHGIVSNVEKIQIFSDWVEYAFKRKVFNVEIGDGQITSLFMPLDKQLDILCKNIYAEPTLQDGFDFIGISQGGLLARGYVQRCNAFPVRNLINLVSPNGGVFIDFKYVTGDMYKPIWQNSLSISGYWRDPNALDDYVLNCSYLPIINNEKPTALSSQYKERILSLQNFVVIWSPNDHILTPPESGKFSVFDSNYNIIPLEDTSLYINDLLGLRELAHRGNLGMFETNCSHQEHKDPMCFEQLYKILHIYL